MYQALIAELRFEGDVGPARQERSLATREKILEAAIAAFSMRGFDGASTHDIAALAGVNQGLVRYYFGSKRELWRCVIDTVMGHYRNDLADYLARPDLPAAREFYRFLLTRYLRWAAENTRVVRILLDINRSDQEGVEWYTQRHIRPLFAVWTALIIEGQAQGVIRTGPAENIYYQLVSTILVFTIPGEVEILTGRASTSASFIEDHTNVLIDMLMTDAST